jgi:hypothetical protein
LSCLLKLLDEFPNGPACVPYCPSNGKPLWSQPAHPQAADNAWPHQQDLGDADIIKHFGIMVVACRVLSITGRVKSWLQLN